VSQATGTPTAQAGAPQPAQTGNTQFVRNDPGTVAVRRCLELGGSDLECIAKGLTTGLSDLSGVNTDALVASNTPDGIRLGRTFKTAGGEALGFNEDVVNIASCGKLEPEGHNYSVTKRGEMLQVEIATPPKPLAVTLGPDGRLTGPAPFPLDGQVIVGYQTVWVEQRRGSDNTVIPGSGHSEQRPIYEKRTEQCAFGSLGATARSMRRTA